MFGARVVNAGLAVERDPAVTNTAGWASRGNVSLFIRSCPALAGIGSLNHHPPESSDRPENATPANNPCSNAWWTLGRVEFAPYRTVRNQPFVGGEAVASDVTRADGRERRVGRVHARTRRQVDTLQPQRVYETARVARDKRAIHRQAGNRLPAALGQSLRAVTNSVPPSRSAETNGCRLRRWNRSCGSNSGSS